MTNRTGGRKLSINFTYLTITGEKREYPVYNWIQAILVIAYHISYKFHDNKRCFVCRFDLSVLILIQNMLSIVATLCLEATYLALQAHSCVEKAGMLSLVKMRELSIDDNFSLRGPVLKKAIRVRIT